MEIREDDLSGPDIGELLRHHLENMHRITPAGSVHAHDVARLREPDVTFWSAWDGDELLGCAALKELDARTGEIKSMRTSQAHRRRGVATALLEHVLVEAARRGYRLVHLETGASDGFAAARALYARHGFEPRGPFGDYADDPHSVFMTRRV